MTQKNTRRAFLASLMALLLCISSLMGTTYAWFTDSVTSANNVITSGNLDIEFEYWKDGKWVDVKDASDVLTNTLWEPGVTEVAYLRVANAGSLSLKYKLGINIVSEIAGKNAEGKEFLLSDYIQFGVVEGVDGSTGAYATREDAVAAVTSPKKISKGYGKASHMAPGDALYLALVVFMPTTVTNDANHDGVNVPKINLGLNVVATQYTAEEDSFDEFYDGGAPWLGDVDTSWYDPAATELTISSAEQLAGLAAIVNGGDATMSASAAASPIVDDFKGKTIKLTSDIDLNGVEWTPIGRIGVTSTDFTNAFNGTFDGQGHTIYNLNVSNEGWAGVFGVAYKAIIKNLKVDGATINSNRMVGTIVGQLYGSIDNCHVSTATITVVPNATATGFDNGDKVGGIVGWIGDNGNNHSLTNCSAEDITLKAYRDVGGIAGYVAYSTVVKNNKVSEIDITIDQATGFYGLKEANAGAVWGRNSVSNTGEGVVYGDNEESDVTIVVPTYIDDVDSLKDALKNGGKYHLADNLTVTETLTLPKNVETVLYMNGKTITGTNSATATHNDLFLVKGTLTVNGGTITLTHAAANMAWDGATSVFDVTDGGVLNLNGVTAENLGGTDMNFVAHLNNWGEVTLNVQDSTLKATYCAVRVFNSGYDMNNVTIKNSTIYSKGNRAFWVHNYLGDLDSSKHSDDAIKARLNFDIFGNGNTYVAETNTNGGIIRYGFNTTVYYNADGVQVVTAPITAPVAPLEEDFLFPAGTNAVLYKDMVMSGDAQIVHTENAVLGLSNVKATVDHDLIVRKSGGAICISDCDFTLTDGAKLISVGEGGDGYQVFLINVTVNGELLTQENAGKYLEGITWFGAYPAWPNT